MKKVLALTMAMILVYSASVMAFAVPGPSTSITGMADGADVLDDSKIADFGSIVLGTRLNILEIPIKWDGFTGATSTNDINEDIMNNMRIVFTNADTQKLFKSNENIEYHHSSRYESARIILTAEDIGDASGFVYVEYYDLTTDTTTESKRVPINGSFIDPTINKKITGFTGLNLFSIGATLNGKAIHPNFSKNCLVDLNITSSSVIAFELNTDFFIWQPDLDGMTTAVRKSTLDNERISVVTKIHKGKQAIQSVAIENVDGRAFVILRFTEWYVSVDEIEFELDIALARIREKDVRTEVTLSGVFGNPTTYVNGMDSYADVADGCVVEAEGPSQNVRLNIGADTTLFVKNMPTGKRVYARATDKSTEDDLAIMAYYPVIRKAITTASVNVSSKNDDIVQIAMNKLHYIYDAEGYYLGTTDERVPFRNKYYLAVERIEFTGAYGDVFDENAPISFFEINDSDNANYNPSTGA